MCQTKIADTINNGKLFSQYVQNSDYDTMVKSAESFEAMIAAIHPITESCWFGLFEYGQTGQHYGKTFMDFSHLTYNMIHNAGKVYDTIFYLLKHQKTHSELKGTSDDYQQEWYFKLGIYYGTAIYLMFYSGNEPEPYDAYTDYQGL